jgi:hypothetical protein
MTPTAASAALNGGKPFTVKLAGGASETVIVRALGIREFEKYLALFENEPEVAEMLCDKPAGWADKLEPGSLGDLVTFGEEVNAPFFQPWVSRRMSRKERLLKGIAGNKPAPSSSTSLLPSSP